MSKAPPPPPAPEFDDAGWDGAEIAKHDVIQDCLDIIFAGLDDGINKLELLKRATADAVDHAIESGLVAVDMLYVERDDNPVSEVSTTNRSWEVEAAPEACDMDSWLRAAIPETSVDKPSYAMEQFLKQQQARPSVGRSLSKTASRRSSVISPPTGNSRPGSASGKKGRETSPNNRKYSQLGKSTTKKVKVPVAAESKAVEDRLREELEIRRAQEEKARELEAKDAEAKAKLAAMQRSLKGKDYTYDHKGQMVVLTPVNADGRNPLAADNPDYRVKTPESPHALNRQRSLNARKLGGGAGSKSLARREGGKDKGNFREAASLTQPSALETLMPQAGVTLRAGGQAKMGPQRPKGVGGPAGTGPMSRDEYARFVATKQQAQAMREAHASAAALAAVMGVAPPPPSSQTSLATLQPAGPGAAPSVADSRRPSMHPYDSMAHASANPLATLPDTPGVFLGAKPKASGPGPKPSTPDVNLSLLTAPDWGRGGGSRGFEAPASLPVVKPNDRQRELEVGRTARLPRDRASQATLSPPLSPTRGQAAAQQPAYGRVQG
mmetsp:Transcript_21315/g.46552  ORF Transcript_21315/g.46552 Transcript_21315/m.46552 type:complete len:552 (+) Transcript_21315:178-1833(+)|eukprot:CAMPEP_0202902328 /NCGR_PEP_ID=MMETSP1392-20130828/16792_1 /ASSEMBLY_ACC=CAM_ASM_000868 /TAXON_ID=225041 /ORGANISM="Chlamydomonas chlamydogama, Strain SAG 11-48b" /LENGTH=551 /DNA_ID=CAMNT_0049589077 /DNA_START=115 /DNA_END=1770 /DNA_ORIENTATION=-